MPPSSLPEPQLKQVIAFVKSLGAPAIDTVVPGNPDVGRQIFFGKEDARSVTRLQLMVGSWVPTSPTPERLAV